jgi:hypothetical protein
MASTLVLPDLRRGQIWIDRDQNWRCIIFSDPMPSAGGLVTVKAWHLLWSDSTYAARISGGATQTYTRTPDCYLRGTAGLNTTDLINLVYEDDQWLSRR